MKLITFLLLASLASFSSCVVYYPAPSYSNARRYAPPPPPPSRVVHYYNRGGQRYYGNRQQPGSYQRYGNPPQLGNSQLGQWRNGLYYPNYTPPNASFNAPAYPNGGQGQQYRGAYRRR